MGCLVGRKLALIALISGLMACLALAPAAGAKPKKGGGAVDITKVANAPIPDRAPGNAGLSGILTSTIDVGKAFKGKRIRDVNVTLQTLGTSGDTPAQDLQAKLTAPNGATLLLFNEMFAGFAPVLNRSIGPLTLDDEALFDIGRGPPHDSTQLFAPWAGSAAPDGGVLAQLDNGPVRGSWTLTMIDLANPQTSNLVSWRLNVLAGRPYLPK